MLHLFYVLLFAVVAVNAIAVVIAIAIATGSQKQDNSC